MYSNFLLIFKNVKYIIGYVIGVCILGYLWWNFTDFALMKGNYGEVHYYIDMFLSLVNIFLFPLFIAAWIFRSYTFGKIQAQRGNQVGFIGGIIGILISGSICCGSSVLLVLGASTITNFLSEYLIYGGLELKIIGVALLIYAIVSLFNNLLVCQLQTKHKK